MDRKKLTKKEMKQEEMKQEEMKQEEQYHIFTVVNPVSDGGKTGKIWPGYFEKFVERGIELTVKETKYSGHAVELVREALESGFTRIMTVGGDGTVNEAVNGMFRQGELVNPDTELIIFSRGTGSDFVRSLGISGSFEDIVQLIRRGKRTFFDLGLVTYVTQSGTEEKRYFINVADAGMGGATIYNLKNSSADLGGVMTYLYTALKTLATYHNKAFTLKVDGREVLNRCLNSIMVANGEYFGGGMKITPGADLQDGEFNILIIGDLNKLEVLINLYKTYRGTHLSHPGVEMIKGKKVEINSIQETWLEIDGELVGNLPAVFEIITNRLPVLII